MAYDKLTSFNVFYHLCNVVDKQAFDLFVEASHSITRSYLIGSVSYLVISQK